MSYSPVKGIGDTRVVTMWEGRLHPVYRSQIPEYVDDELYSAVNLWNRWKQFGLPFGGGWAEQPAHVVEAIEAVEHGIREYNARNGR